MTWESKSGGRMHRLDTPGVFLSDSGGWRMTLWNFNFRSKVSSGWQLFSAKMFLKWWILLDKSFATNDCLDLAFLLSTRSFTSLPGGNKVDGSPPESSSFRVFTFFSDRSRQCASYGVPKVEFCRQGVENEQREVSWVMNFWLPKCCENDDFQMSWESKCGGRMHRRDTPEVFLSDSGGWRMTLWNFNFRSKVSSGWQLFSAKMFLKWWILLDKSSATNDCLA